MKTIIRSSVFLLFIQTGPTASAAEPLHLSAGPLSVTFDPDTASLRDVRIGQHLVFSGINAPVRDHHWGTVHPVVSNIVHTQDSTGFELSFNVACRKGDIDFPWKGTVRGSADGRLEFSFDGQARSTFLKNRIGICLLHGAEAAGKSCVVETVNGDRIRGRFPTFIAPDQPFKSIRAMAHEIQPGLWARVRFEGDIFETEDQRNWTDASFKTYCTPLALPYPARVEKETRIRQTLKLTIDGDLAALKAFSRNDGGAIVLSIAEIRGIGPVLPGIGLRFTDRAEPVSDAELSKLAALKLDHLRVDITPSDARLKSILRNATAMAERLDAKLHVALHLGDSPEPELANLVRVVKSLRAPVAVWWVNAANPETLALARAHLKPLAPAAWIGAGESTNFTELNRNRPDVARIDAVSYGLNPQVHAFDDLSMIETLAIQGETVRSARQFIGDLPLVIGPITLKPQPLNQDPQPDKLPSSVDPRQTTLFAAAWTLGSMKYLAEAGVHAITYFQPVGWHGVIEADSGSPLPDAFPSQPGTVYPVYHVLGDVGEFSGASVRPVTSTAPRSVIGLALEKENQFRLLVANLSGRSQRVEIHGIGPDGTVYRLDGSNVRSATAQPAAFRRRSGETFSTAGQTLSLTLPAHGLARIDRR